MVLCDKRKNSIVRSFIFLKSWLSLFEFHFWEDFIYQSIWITSRVKAWCECSNILFKSIFWRLSSKQPKCFAFDETFTDPWWQEAKCVYWNVSVGLQWVRTSRIDLCLNLSHNIWQAVAVSSVIAAKQSRATFLYNICPNNCWLWVHFTKNTNQATALEFIAVKTAKFIFDIMSNINVFFWNWLLHKICETLDLLWHVEIFSQPSQKYFMTSRIWENSSNQWKCRINRRNSYISFSMNI